MERRRRLTDPDRVDPHDRALREAARAVDSWAFTEGPGRTQELSRRIVEGFLANFDILVTPTMACLPPLIGEWRAGTEDDPLRAVRNTYPMAVFTSVRPGAVGRGARRGRNRSG